VLGCSDEAPEGAQIEPGLHMTVLQAEIYTFMTWGKDNIGNGYTHTGTSIFLLTVQQPLWPLIISKYILN
jgi:hypothetical protein